VSVLGEGETRRQLILGTAQLSQDYGVLRVNGSAEARRILEFVATYGFLAVDTAPSYGNSEKLIGDAALDLPIHTKIDPRSSPRQSFEESCRRLGTKRLDVLYFHDQRSLEIKNLNQMRAAYALVEETKVGALGVSIYDGEYFRQALDTSQISAIQIPLNFFDRRIANIAEASVKPVGLSIYARSCLLQGLLVAPLEKVRTVQPLLYPYVKRFHEICADLKRSTLNVAVQWVRAHSWVDGWIFGSPSISELREIVSAFDSEPLSEEDLSALQDCELPNEKNVDPRYWNHG
jgi:aryl-alcohol dehydrogenase-like predicted oxidoreductase